MTEVEKLYKLANIQKRCVVYSDSYYYPPFTAEKQIAIIKWLAKNKQGFGLDYYADLSSGAWECGVKFEWEVYKYTKENEVFEEALVSLINNLWQDLTEAEQNEIKEILK